MKTLITDQLIERYGKLKSSYDDFFEATKPMRQSIELAEYKLIEQFLEHLQSLRQQEVDNVIEAYGVAKINVLTNNVRALQNGNDYFTQTFE